MDSQNPRLLPALVLSAVVALAAALGSLLYMETASVKLLVPPHRLQADMTLNAGPNGPDLKTQHFEVTITESQQGTATITPIPPAYASGQVVFSCSPACPTGTALPKGTIVATAKNVQFQTMGTVVVPASGPSGQVPIRASQGGAAGNTAASTITVVSGQHSPSLHVTNPSPTTGGADARTEQSIQQSDFDTVANALTTKVTDELTAALKSKAVGMTYVADGPPTLNLTSDYTVGDKTPIFHIKIAGSLSAIAFSEVEARGLLRSALEQKVPTGFELTQDAIQTNYQILRVSSKGDVAISGSAVGFIAPTLETTKLTAQIRGMSLADARRHLQRAAPGSQVEITTRPGAVYWLPLITKHITLTVVVQPAPA